MKNKKMIYTKITILIALAFGLSVSCERGLSDEAVFATYPNTAEIFTDTPVGLGSNFYFPYSGSKPTAWTVDDEVSYQGSASMRFDVPDATDTAGNYAGAIFRIDGDDSGRNLTGFDALTFWAKATQSVTIGEVGFGEDFGENKYLTTRTNLNLTTNWVKYIIPIPDASKLVQVRGMLRYSAGTQGTNGLGFTFWMDEVRFEKLGTVAQPRPAIFNGVHAVQQSFVGSTIKAYGLTQTLNLASGINQTTNIAPSYFTFKSSDIEVARISELGEISILKAGNAVITATLAGVKAQGSLILEVSEAFNAANTPPARNPADVISVFSDAYTNVADLNFAVFNDANVQIQVENYVGNRVAYYNNLSFVGLGWNGTSNVSGMTHLHIDVQVIEPASPTLTVELIDFGANNSDGGGDDTGGGFTIPQSNLTQGTWRGIDIPINGFAQATGGGFAGSPNLNNVARVVLVSNGGSFIIDNIYFYK